MRTSAGIKKNPTADTDAWMLVRLYLTETVIPIGDVDVSKKDRADPDIDWLEPGQQCGSDKTRQP